MHISEWMILILEMDFYNRSAQYFILAYCLQLRTINSDTSLDQTGTFTIVQENEHGLLSRLAENSFRLISNNKFDIGLWISRLQFILEGVANAQITVMNIDSENLQSIFKNTTPSFMEHLVLLSCNTPAQFQNVMTNGLGKTMEGTTFLVFVNQSAIHHLPSYTELINSSFFTLNSNIYIITSNTDSHLSMFEIYTLKTKVVINNLPTAIHFAAPIQHIRQKWSTRKTLDGVQITAIATKDPQTEYVIVSGSIVLTSGIGSNILRFFQDALKFKSKIILETVWPKQLENGSWIGMGQTLQEGKADLIVVLTTFLPSRAAAFTIAHPHLNNALVAVFLQPSILYRNVYMSPFKPGVWCSILGVVLGIFVSFRVIMFHLKYVFTYKREDNTSERHCSTAGDTIMWVLSGVCKQGWIFWLDSSATGNTNALKIIACIVFPCTTLIISNYFGAFLYKFLSAEPIPIKTLNDLIKSDLYFVADNSSQTVLNLLMHPETVSWESEDTATMITKKKRIIKLPKFAKSDIVSGEGAFVTYPTTLNVENSNSWRNTGDGKDLCDIGKRLSVLQFSTPYSAGILMPKGSVYKDLFNIQIIVLMESGLMFRYSKDFIIQRPRCLNPNDILYGNNAPNLSTISLSVTDLLTAFVIFFVGLALCLLVYCGEMVYENARNRYPV